MVNINDLVGVAYINGGRSVTQGLDCWGLVREYYRRDGLTLPKFPINATHTDEVMDEIKKNQVNWEKLEEKIPSLYAKRGKIPKDAQKRMIAAYYALITHIDNQLSRFLTAVEEFDLLENTIFWFVSDHGDQLGEHYLFRKGYPYQGSIKIPAFIFDPGNLIAGTKKSVQQLIKIQDVFPSLVELATGNTVQPDGKSVRQLLFGEFAGWRNEFHGEHSLGVDSSQYILTDEWKFIWFPVTNEFQLFHMTEDPNEKWNLIAEEKYTSLIHEFKVKLARYLEGREEGFVQEGKLCPVPLEKIVSTLKRGE